MTQPTDDRPAVEREQDLRIVLEVASDDELRALRGVLLAARATELGEIQRRAQRHGLGYGTDSQRESMSAEVEHARRRWQMLDRLLSAVDAAVRDAG